MKNKKKNVYGISIIEVLISPPTQKFFAFLDEHLFVYSSPSLTYEVVLLTKKKKQQWRESLVMNSNVTTPEVSVISVIVYSKTDKFLFSLVKIFRKKVVQRWF